MDVLFQTERVWLVRARQEDIIGIIEMESDKANRDFVWTGTYDDHKLEINDKNHELLLFIKKENSSVIGFALVCMDFHSKKCELRRLVVKEKGQGYGKEIMKGLLKYTFENLKLNRFWLDVYPDNLVAINLYESLGLHRDGILRQNYKSQRGYLDQIVYSMLIGEYLEKYK